MPYVSYQALHQVHLLLFMVALFHIFTAAVILVIANLRMRSWWRWKQDDDQEARLCAATSLPQTGPSPNLGARLET